MVSLMNVVAPVPRKHPERGPSMINGLSACIFGKLFCLISPKLMQALNLCSLKLRILLYEETRAARLPTP